MTLRKRLLVSCLLASIALHIGAVWFLFASPYHFDIGDTHSLLKPAPIPTIATKEDEELLVEKIEKALEESLNTVSLASAERSLKQDIAHDQNYYEEDEETEEISFSENKTLFVSKPSLTQEKPLPIQHVANEFASSMPPPFDPEWEASLKDFALDEEFEEGPISHESEKLASIDFTDPQVVEETAPMAQVVEDDYTLTDQQFLPTALPTHTTEGLDPHFVASLKKLKTPRMEAKGEKMFAQLSESTAPKLILPNSVDYLRSQWVKRSLADRSLPELDHYGLENIATQLEWEEDLDIDIALMPAPEGGKYVFSLTIHPEFDTECSSIPQNFYFLIDRSNSVDKGKFNRFKRAVQRSLAALQEGDTFNIYIFDKNVSKLSSRNLPVTSKSIQMAEDFLEGQTAKTHFAATEVYSSLDRMLPEKFHPDELHSVILITDGNTLLSSQKQKRALAGWTEKYKDTVNFYAAAAGKGNNLVLLDLLSYSTSGKMLYSDTNAGFPRKLVHLVKDLHNPLVKNVTVDITPSDTNARVALYPQGRELPPMFANQPYVITGTIDELSDLTLYIQGKNNDKWLNVRKRLTLSDATKGGRSLEKLWAHTQSKICYDHFLKNGKASHLKEAVQIVAPYRGIIAAEQ
ncbi:MAG: VWA domain-containing protein [Simkaniaceae bacterium]|nr:VWA domain-containing protein [Candidatus Sacchlamyda saccharinae]